MNSLPVAFGILNDILAGPYLIGFIILFLGMYMLNPILMTIGVLTVAIVLATALFISFQ